MSFRVLVIHGPNLALLGRREPEIYGTVGLAEIRAAIESRARVGGHRVSWVDSNHEGKIVDALNEAFGAVDGILINPGALTHTSVALRDALVAVGVPTIEVHLSNIHAREDFRRHSVIADVVTAQISGLGAAGEVLAFDALIDRLRGNPFPPSEPTED